MPRWTVRSDGSRDATKEFDLCARCSADPEVMRVVARKKAGEPLGEGASPAVLKLPHSSYDFAPRPVPCISCARILSAEDD
ncbi:MAG TPA: hypothetical protein VN842_00245 [Thermoplasmata archaeon]|nr:hypothetical protein [Thermoplasmata archaeon]